MQSTTSDKQCEHNCIRIGALDFLLGRLYNLSLSIAKSLHGKQLLSNGVGSLILYRLSHGEQSTQSSENRSSWLFPSYVREKWNTTKLCILPLPRYPIANLWWDCPSKSYCVVTNRLHCMENWKGLCSLLNTHSLKCNIISTINRHHCLNLQILLFIWKTREAILEFGVEIQIYQLLPHIYNLSVSFNPSPLPLVWSSFTLALPRPPSFHWLPSTKAYLCQASLSWETMIFFQTCRV